MSHYLNPLHAPLPSEFHSQYNVLSHANQQLEPPFPTSLPPSFKRIPQTPPPKLLATRCRSCLHIPVIFELIGAPSRGIGIPMRELVVRSGGALELMIVDANEPVGYLMSGSSSSVETTLIIIWPGYEHVNWSHSLELFSAAGPVTRSQLAVQIAFAFSAFVAQMASQMSAPNASGWRIGSSNAEGIVFERLILLALWNACDDYWMAEIYIDSR